MASTTELEPGHWVAITLGDPALRMSRPWSPPRLNFTGIALPAFARFQLGRLSTGWKKPEKP